jgi:DNA repair exonuclease SbcCD ATPase subunit
MFDSGQREIKDISSRPQKRADAVRLKKSNYISDLEKQLNHRQYEAQFALQKELTNRKARLNDATVAIRSIQSLIDSKGILLRKIDFINTEIQCLEEQKHLEEMVSKALGRKGVLGLIFNGILSETESAANLMLAEIPNTSDIAVALSSMTETKSGVIKNEITATITKSGNEISFKSLSGGQKAALSLCTDLALMMAIRRRTNINSGWLALDEAMDGMDVASKEAAIGVLKRVCDGVTILLIDHSTEIKEMFDGIVKIEFDGKTSRVLHD